MEMKILHKEYRLCTCCMEEHEVKMVSMQEHLTFKGIVVEYIAKYTYCDIAEELYANEEQMQENDIVMKDAYREIQGLLTSEEINNIRKKYGITQSDMCLLLGWGGKTITRYESHQVQDKAHDTILKKLDQDPEWFMVLLEQSKSSFSAEVYRKYFESVAMLYEKNQDWYLRKSIEAKYVKYRGNGILQGNTVLSLNKVIDVIRYFAASARVKFLYKVKLMKLLWYSDALSYKMQGHAITGLAYQAMPMGAVPIGHETIIDLKGVPCEEVDMGETIAYHFELKGNAEYPSLSEDDKRILDIVIDRFGEMNKDEIVNFMHAERAYKETAPREVISFRYAENLQI